MTGAPRLGVVLDYVVPFAESADDVREFDRMGIDLVTVAEAYSFDAVSQLGYLAAITTRTALTSGVLGVFTRTPTTLAMTAAGLDAVSGGRFELGIGTSAPGVVEGFHGVPFEAPLRRLRETVEICRAVWRHEPLQHEGRHPIPLPAAPGAPAPRPLKLVNRPVRATIPVTVAALSPKAVEQAAAIADGWLPLFYFPERADVVWGADLAAGRVRRDPALGPLDVIAQMPLAVGDDTEQAVAAHRARIALYVGGMGAKGRNFYNTLAARYGFPDAAAEIQERYLAGAKADAAAAVPDELVHGTALIGTEAEVALRVAAIVASGATTISVQPVGPIRSARVEAVEAVQSILQRTGAASSPGGGTAG